MRVNGIDEKYITGSGRDKDEVLKMVRKQCLTPYEIRYTIGRI